jgi:hypothetical protein
MDDVLIMTRDSLQEWKEIDDILKIFCKATAVAINFSKSTFHHSGIQGELLENFKELFPYNYVDLYTSFRYLGYLLKSEKYKAEDWR